MAFKFTEEQLNTLDITLLPADLQTGGKLQMEIVDWT